jgi:hypothetical protein
MVKEKERFSNKTYGHLNFNQQMLSKDFAQRISGIELKNTELKNHFKNSRDFHPKTLQNSQMKNLHVKQSLENELLEKDFQKGFDSQVSKMTPNIPTIHTVTNNNSIKTPTNKASMSKYSRKPIVNLLNGAYNFNDQQAEDYSPGGGNKIDFSSLEFPSGMMAITPKLSKEVEYGIGHSQDSNIMLVHKTSNQMSISKYQASNYVDSQQEKLSNSKIEEMEDEYYMVEDSSIVP